MFTSRQRDANLKHSIAFYTHWTGECPKLSIFNRHSTGGNVNWYIHFGKQPGILWSSRIVQMLKLSSAIPCYGPWSSSPSVVHGCAQCWGTSQPFDMTRTFQCVIHELIRVQGSPCGLSWVPVTRGGATPRSCREKSCSRTDTLGSAAQRRAHMRAPGGSYQEVPRSVSEKKEATRMPSPTKHTAAGSHKGPPRSGANARSHHTCESISVAPNVKKFPMLLSIKF